MEKILKYFDFYTKIGLKPIAVYKDSKIPVGKNWNKNYSGEFCRSLIQTGDYNIGILLGDIVDVEGDTEEANALLKSMIGDIPHPSYKSSKSTHHLFINPDKNLTAIFHEGIEFRAYKHQSVVPPSCHENGVSYNWLQSSSFPIPDMPKALMDFYYNIKSIKKKRKSNYQKSEVKNGNIKTHCNNCKNVFYVNRKRIILESRAFIMNGQKWMCRGCRKIDVREDCRAIRKIQKSIGSNSF